MRIVRLGLVCLAASIAWTGCRAGEAEPAHAPELTVTVVHPVRRPAIRSLTLPGDVIGFNEAALYAKVTGYLERIDVDKGDWVQKGQPLATIEVPELLQKLKRARASRAVAKGAYQRLQSVWDSDHRLVARQDVDIAEGNYEQAQAEVEEFEALLSYSHIVAPFAGVVTARYVDPGALIEADGQTGTTGGDGGAGHGRSGKVPIVKVADIDRLRVYVYVPEAETSRVQRGMPATLRLREFPGREFHGTVARFAMSLELSTRTMLTEVDLDNPKHELYPGMYADVDLELERHPDALQVPVTSVEHAGQQGFVFAVRDGKLVKLPVETGIQGEELVEVTSGLDADAAVVTNPTPSLSAGAAVQAVIAETHTGAPAG